MQKDSAADSLDAQQLLQHLEVLHLQQSETQNDPTVFADASCVCERGYNATARLVCAQIRFPRPVQTDICCPTLFLP